MVQRKLKIFLLNSCVVFYFEHLLKTAISLPIKIGLIWLCFLHGSVFCIFLRLHNRTHNVHFQSKRVNDAEKHADSRLYNTFLNTRDIGLVCSHFLGKV